MQKLFAQLADEEHLTGIEDLKTFAARAAYYTAEINAIHPFREGNGRCQLTFLKMLLRNSGVELDEDNLHPQRFVEAMIDSFHGDNRSLAQEIEAMIAEIHWLDLSKFDLVCHQMRRSSGIRHRIAPLTHRRG